MSNEHNNTIVTTGDIHELRGRFHMIASARPLGRQEPFFEGVKEGALPLPGGACTPLAAMRPPAPGHGPGDGWTAAMTREGAMP